MSSTTTTWRAEIAEALADNGETESDIIETVVGTYEKYDPETRRYLALPGSLDMPFDSGYGGINGCTFTVWTEKYVYFPACYDGSEWVASVARDPDGVATEHIGGG